MNFKSKNAFAFSIQEYNFFSMLKVWRTLKPYLRGNTGRFLVGVLALFAVDGFQIVIPLVVRRAVNEIANGTATVKLLLICAGIIMALAVGVIVTRFLWRFMIIGISRRMEKTFRADFYRHLLSLSPSWFSKRKVGDLMALATNDLEAVRMMVGIGTVAVLDMAFLIVTSLSMMIYISPKLTLYVFLPLPILSIIMLYLGEILEKRFEKVQETFARLTDFVRETISGIRVIKAYVRNRTQTNLFELESKEYIKRNMKMVLIGGAFDPLIGMVIGVAFAIILLIGGKNVILARMSMGDFVAYTSYLDLLIWPMIALGWVINLYQRGKASLGRIREIMEQPVELTDLPDSIELESVKGEIEFKNLTFRYAPELPEVLKDVTFKIPAGSTVGIIGKMGAGKSTLVHLINRLFDPPYGTVLLDGCEIHKIKLRPLRTAVTLVPQDSFLFSETIIDNIKFGKPDATDEEAIWASKIAQLDKDVINFPDGYKTYIGERGVTLSGGQKQRLSIARAILLDTPVLILDDAFSAVDTETEEQILLGIRKIRDKKTTIIVSHRISTIKNSDLIVVLDNGKVSQIGQHEELVAQKGFYRELYLIQQLGEELNN